MGYKKITIYGNQTSDYLYISKTKPQSNTFQYINSEPAAWDSSTLLLAKFDDNLTAGNSVITNNITGYEIRRREGSKQYTEHIDYIRDRGEYVKQKYVIDYSVKNNTEYTYYLYPSVQSEDKEIILSPMVTKSVTPDWSYWSLLVVDDTEEDNVFYLSKMFKFELNVSESDMSNNASVTIKQNFTKYPIIQYGMSNYWSGELSSLCGYLACHECEYIQTPNMIEEIKSLTSDTRRKFLKDTSGNLYEVKIAAPISISNLSDTASEAKIVRLPWAEVADASGISIVNNPAKPSVDWLLTETGELIPYIENVWDEQYVWDNNYIWTAKEDTLETEASNLGRLLTGNEGG